MEISFKGQKARELAGLHLLSSLVSETGDLDTILRRSLAGILKFLGLPTGRICLREDGTGRFVTMASRGVPKAIRPLHRPFKKRERFFGTGTRLGKSHLIPDLLKEKNRKSIPSELIEAGYRFFYALPLYHHGEVLGILELYSRKPSALNDFDRSLIELFSNHLGCMIGRKRLVDQREHSERRYRQMIETAQDLFFEVDRDGRFMSISGASRELLGYDPDEMIGRTMYEFSAPEAIERHRKAFSKALRGDIYRVEVLARNRSDERVYLELFGSRILEGRRILGVRGVARDITDRKSAETELAQRYREITSLQAITDALSHSDTLKAMLKRVGRQILALTGCNALGFYFLDEQAQELRLVSPINLPKELVQALSRLPLGDGVAGHVVRTGRPEILPDIESDPRIPKALRQHFPGRAGAAFPLISRGRVIGTINMVGQTPPFRYTETMLMIGREVGVAVENQRLYEEVQHKETALKELSHQVITALEAERKRIARELHDEVGQALTGVRINLSLIEKAAEMYEGMDLRPFGTLYKLIDETLENVSRLAYDLRPAMLDDLGLPTALQWYCRSFRERTGINVTLMVRGKLDSLSDRIGTYLYRFLQEGLTNVARHADARKVRVTITRARPHVSIRVTDDGRGFDPLHIMRGREVHSGQGLFGLRGRTELLDGEMKIESSKKKGTSLIARIPLER